jgi:hypothetical protein
MTGKVKLFDSFADIRCKAIDEQKLNYEAVSVPGLTCLSENQPLYKETSMISPVAYVSYSMIKHEEDDKSSLKYFLSWGDANKHFEAVIGEIPTFLNLYKHVEEIINCIGLPGEQQELTPAHFVLHFKMKLLFDKGTKYVRKYSQKFEKTVENYVDSLVSTQQLKQTTQTSELVGCHIFQSSMKLVLEHEFSAWLCIYDHQICPNEQPADTMISVTFYGYHPLHKWHQWFERVNQWVIEDNKHNDFIKQDAYVKYQCDLHEWLNNLNTVDAQFIPVSWYDDFFNGIRGLPRAL